MDRDEALAARFEANRDHLRAVAYRMLGSLDEADDAVQQAWLRADRTDLTKVENLAGWLTTVTARVCLDILRARRRRKEQRLPAPGTFPAELDSTSAPEEEAVLAEQIGLALLVVLDRLSPPQRVAFVLHDLFGVPFEEIAAVVDRSMVATKKLASRARRQVRGGPSLNEPDRVEHHAVVHAFVDAARGGDLDALLALLAPDVVRRADRFAVSTRTKRVIKGARTVADETTVFAARARSAAVALVDGTPGIVVAPAGRLFAVIRVTVDDGRISEFDVIADPEQLSEIDVTVERVPLT